MNNIIQSKSSRQSTLELFHLYHCMLKMLVTVDTVFTADTVEWCPASEDIFGCGTYQLDEPKSIRFGSLMLFSWNGLKCVFAHNSQCFHCISTCKLLTD